MKKWLKPLAATLRRPRWLMVLAGACLASAAAGYFVWNERATDDLRRRTDDLRQQASAAMEDRDFETAKTRLQAYVSARPTDGEARFLLAQAYRRARIEDLNQAHENLYQARHLGYTGEDVELESALLEVQEHGSSVARGGTLQHYLDAGGPPEALVLEALARGCIAQNRLADANSWLNRWVDHFPDDWYPRLWRGALFEYMNLASLAVTDFDFVRNKRPGDEAIRVRVGLMLSRSGLDNNTALKYLEPYGRAHPDDVDVAVAEARCRRTLHQPAEAEALLKPVVAAHPDDVDALLTLALVEWDRNTVIDDNHALEHLRRLEPLVRQSHPQPLLERLRRLEPVLNHVDAPERKHVVFSLSASILDRLGRTAEAKDKLAEADQIEGMMTELNKNAKQFQQNPQDVAALEKVGTLYMDVGMPEEGVAVLNQVLRMNPDDLAAHQALDKYYKSIGAAPPSSNLQGP